MPKIMPKFHSKFIFLLSIYIAHIEEEFSASLIGNRDFQKQGLISTNDGFEVWRIVLSTKLRYGQEALAKIVHGKSN